MVRAWYFTEGSDGDQRLPHMPDPPVFLGLPELYEKTGVQYLTFPAEDLEKNADFKKLKTDRGYTYEDVCEISPKTMPNYEEKIKMFFKEHIHSDEEIRYIEAGKGYFDVRDRDDRWIRVEVVKDDMLIVPAGIYHRFTLDETDYIKAKRLFVGEPVWTPINRPADDHPARKEWLQTMANGPKAR